MGLPAVAAFPTEIPTWMVDGAKDLIVQAETAIVGRGRGNEKKAWVKGELKKIAAAQDIPWLPEPIESVVEGIVIDIVVDVAFKAIRDRLPRG
jgi:hypothetical protein